MRPKKKRQIKAFSIVASFLMIFSLITPVVSSAESEGELQRSVNKTQTEKVKISDRLMDEFKNDEKVTFLIKFNEKADVEKAAADAVSSAGKAKLSAHKTELMKRSAVVSELKATALTSQQNVKDFLNKEVKNDNAENVTSYHIVNGMAVTATKEVAQKVATFSEVERILPNEKRELIEPVSTDAKTYTADDDVEWSVDRIGASDVWATGIDGTGTVVASIDTGVQWDHPALKEKYRGYDAETGEVDHNFNWFDATAGESEPYDDQGHGTHTIGTMVGGEPDGSNQIGVAPGAAFISVKAFDGSGGATDADLLAAGEWVLAPTDADGNERVDLAPDVVNNSWGGGKGLDEWYRDMVIAWRAADIFPEFSAGNTDLFNPGGPGSIATPANYPESFATGATDKDDMISEFSLRGPSPYDEIKPDISAPGVSIRSSMPGGEYGGNSGTSMAGPAVSGVALLLRQVNASITVDDMEEVLKSTATERTDDEYPESPNHGYGYGIVNAYDAVLSMQDGFGMIEGKVTKADDGEAAGKDKTTLHSTKSNLQPSGVSAQISVLESGRSANTNPEDGTYSLTHAPGAYTLQAEGYGFHSDEQAVTVEKDRTTEVNFPLSEIDQYTVSGTITDEVTADPIENATVIIVEDANVTPAKTDENGRYDFDAYVGDYTLKVVASNHYSKEIEVTIDEDISDLDVKLRPFYGYPGGEIAYDDGERASANINLESGNGYAVRMSLPEGEEQAMVTGGKFLFTDDSGDEFQVEVYDASGPNGSPGRKIAGPIDATVAEDNEWMTVDLKNQGIIVEGDFYMVYMQSQDGDYSPWISVDAGNPFSERSWRFYQGEWKQYKESDPIISGNIMIRALVDYEVDSPVITSPVEDYLTGESEITVEGTASPTTTIQLMNNGEEAGSEEVGDDGKFALPIELTEGENTITAVSEVDGDPAEESESVTVTLDTKAPALTIDNPKDGDKSNRETVTVEGTVDDDHPDFVEVNGQKATVEDGSYSKRILLDNGKNEIEVVAQDEVGNSTSESVTIQVKYDAPEIENLTPTEDITIEAGESVKVEFDSEPGLKTSFFTRMPLINAKASIANATELPMMETSEGHYVGYWTATKNATADGAVLEVKAVDDFGNEVRKKAEGKLYINTD